MLTLFNQSKTVPVYINGVRAHFGRPDYTYYFIFEPSVKTEIAPKDNREFQMPGNRIGRRQRDKDRMPSGTSSPSLEQPRDLFRAIMNGKPEDSWIEIDYNEVEQHVVLAGSIKKLFAEAARIAGVQ